MRDKHIVELFDLLLEYVDEVRYDKEGAAESIRRQLVNKLQQTGMSESE